jgi:hypothetical protein
MVKLFTPEILGYPHNPHPAEMTSPNDATEDDQLFVEYDEYLKLEKKCFELQKSVTTLRTYIGIRSSDP